MSEIPSTDSAQHPIRVAQRRIAEVFARGASLPRSESAPGLLSCVVPIAEAVGWRGTPRQIAEAMPHETLVTDVGMFRTVLLRLGIETEKVNVPAHRIRNEYCPCMAVNGQNSLVFIQSVDAQGTARIFDSQAAAWQTVNRLKLVGEVYLVRLLDPFVQQEQLQRDGFVWPLLRRFSDSLKMVFWQSLAINLLGLVVSFYVMYVYDKAIGGKSVDTLTLLFIGGLAAVGMELRLRHRRAAAIARLGARFDALAATGAFRTVLGLPLGMSENAPLSAQLTRFRQLEVGRELFGGSLATSLIDLPFTIIFFIMIFALGGTLGFVPVAFGAVLLLVGLCTTPGLSKQIRDMGDWKAKSDSLLIEICTRLKLIRADNAEDVWLHRTSESYRNYLISKFQQPAVQQYSASPGPGWRNNFRDRSALARYPRGDARKAFDWCPHCHHGCCMEGSGADPDRFPLDAPDQDNRWNHSAVGQADQDKARAGAGPHYRRGSCSFRPDVVGRHLLPLCQPV